MSEKQKQEVQREKARLLRIRSQVKSGVGGGIIRPLYGIEPVRPLYGVDIKPPVLVIQPLYAV